MTKEDIKTTIPAAAVTELLYGINELCEGLSCGLFERSLHGILTRDKRFSLEENAHSFLYDNYQTLSGAYRLIAASTDIITAMLTNGDIKIVPSEKGFSATAE